MRLSLNRLHRRAPGLGELAGRYEGRTLILVVVSHREEDAAAWERAQELGARHTTLFDTDHDAGKGWASPASPRFCWWTPRDPWCGKYDWLQTAGAIADDQPATIELVRKRLDAVVSADLERLLAKPEGF